MKELQYLNKYFIKYKYHFLAGIFITIIAQIFFSYTPKLISASFKIIENYPQNGLQKSEVLKLLIKNISLAIGTSLIAGFLTFLMARIS